MRWGLTVCVGVATSLSSKIFDEHLASLQTAWNPSEVTEQYFKDSEDTGKQSFMVPKNCWSPGLDAGASEKAKKPAEKKAADKKAAEKKALAKTQFVQDLLVYNDDFCPPCTATEGSCHIGVAIGKVFWPPALRMALVRAGRFPTQNSDKPELTRGVFIEGISDKKLAVPIGKTKFDVCPGFGTPCVARVKGVLRVGPRGSDPASSSIFLASDEWDTAQVDRLRWVHYIEKCVSDPKQVGMITNFQRRDGCGQVEADVLGHNKHVLDWATALMFAPNTITAACHVGKNMCRSNLVYAHMWLSKTSKLPLQVNFKMERDLGYTTQQDGNKIFQHPQWLCHIQKVSWTFSESPGWNENPGLKPWLARFTQNVGTVKPCAYNYNYHWNELDVTRDSLQLSIMKQLLMRAIDEPDDDDSD